MADRAALLDRLNQTILEAEMLATGLASIPDELIWMRPGEQPSIAELLWLINLSDRFRFSPVVDAILHDRHARVEHVHPGILLETDPSPENDLGTILSAIVSARQALAGQLHRLSDAQWNETRISVEGSEVDLEAFIQWIAEHDQEILKEIGYRLYESRIT